MAALQRPDARLGIQGDGPSAVRLGFSVAIDLRSPGRVQGSQRLGTRGQASQVSRGDYRGHHRQSPNRACVGGWYLKGGAGEAYAVEICAIISQTPGKHHRKKCESRAMSDDNIHSAIPGLVDQWERRSISRREFLRTATLLGMSAAAAYRIVGLSPAALAAAQALPQGGTVRIAHPIKDVSNPQALNWFQFADLTFPVVQ